MTPAALESLELAIRQHVPEFEVRYKDESTLMKGMGHLSRVFNPRFMADFTTTWGSKVYFPSRAFYTANSLASFVTLAHEFVHLWDGKEQGLKFQVRYALPQALALIPLLLHALLVSPWPLAVVMASYTLSSFVANRFAVMAWLLLGIGAFAAIVLAIIFTGWYTALLVAGVVMLGPWPSKGRTKAELRGYGMNVAFYTWVRGRLVEDVVIQGISKQFTGPNYWFMSRSPVGIQSTLRATSMRALAGNLVEMPYSVVHGILVQHGLVRRS